MNKLKQLREDAGHTMQSVRDRLEEEGFHYAGRAIVGKWESTGARPRHEVVVCLAKIYKVTTADLYSAWNHTSTVTQKSAS